ncbi:MAG: hypothetical protein ABIP39_00560 [Polyangiaceae bacterium]
MRKVSFFVAAACMFGLAPFAGRLGAVGGSLLLVALAVALAMAASGSMNALAAAGGAIGAFAGSVLTTMSPAVGGATLVGLAFAERTTRVRGRTEKLVHMGGAIVGGALAGSLSSAYASSSLAVQSVAVVVGTVLVALPLLLEADDPIAHALDDAAEILEGPVQESLREGAQLRREADDVVLDREAAKRVRSTWGSLLRLAEARIRLQRAHATRVKATLAGAMRTSSAADAVVEMVDQRISDHVSALTRAYTAVDAARAAHVGLDDAALKSVETVGESLDAVSRAILEVES